jgi:hypothetical protein
MEELQTEIKAIQDALRSIRANEPPRPAPAPTVMTAARPVRPTVAQKPIARKPIVQDEFTGRSQSATGTELAIEAERLNRLTSSYVQRLAQSQPQIEVPSLDQAFQRLDAQAEEVNQLSAAQEAAILRLKAIAEQVEQGWQTQPVKKRPLAGISKSAGRTALKLPPLCETGETALPHIERDQNGNFVLTSRSVDLFRAERDAEFNAEVLRHHAIRTRRHPSLISRLWNWVMEKPEDNSRTLQSKLQRRSLRRSRGASLSIRQCVFLVVSAIVARVVLDTIVAIFPGLWLPAIAVMVLPGAIGIYRSTITPESGLVWGVRLGLVLVGLLIGGRL